MHGSGRSGPCVASSFRDMGEPRDEALKKRAKAIVADLVSAGDNSTKLYSPEPPIQRQTRGSVVSRVSTASNTRERAQKDIGGRTTTTQPKQENNKVPSILSLLPSERASLLKLLSSSEAGIATEKMVGSEDYLVTVSLIDTTKRRTGELVKYQFRTPNFIQPKVSAAVERYKKQQEAKARKVEIATGTKGDSRGSSSAQKLHSTLPGYAKTMQGLLKDVRETLFGICQLNSNHFPSIGQRVSNLTSSSSVKAFDPATSLYLNDMPTQKNTDVFKAKRFAALVHETFALKFGMTAITAKEEERFITSLAVHREHHPEASLFACLLKPPTLVTDGDVDVVRRMFSIILLNQQLVVFERTDESTGQTAYAISTRDLVFMLLRFLVCLDISDGLNISALLFLILREANGICLPATVRPIPSLYTGVTVYDSGAASYPGVGMVSLTAPVVPSAATINTSTTATTLSSSSSSTSTLNNIQQVAYSWLLNVPVSSLPDSWVLALFQEEIESGLFQSDQQGTRTAMEYAQLLVQQGGCVIGAEFCELVLLSISTGRILGRHQMADTGNGNSNDVGKERTGDTPEMGQSIADKVYPIPSNTISFGMMQVEPQDEKEQSKIHSSVVRGGVRFNDIETAVDGEKQQPKKSFDERDQQREQREKSSTNTNTNTQEDKRYNLQQERSYQEQIRKQMKDEQEGQRKTRNTFADLIHQPKLNTSTNTTNIDINTDTNAGTRTKTVTVQGIQPTTTTTTKTTRRIEVEVQSPDTLDSAQSVQPEVTTDTAEPKWGREAHDDGNSLGFLANEDLDNFLSGIDEIISHSPNPVGQKGLGDRAHTQPASSSTTNTDSNTNHADGTPDLLLYSPTAAQDSINQLFDAVARGRRCLSNDVGDSDSKLFGTFQYRSEFVRSANSRGGGGGGGGETVRCLFEAPI